MNAEKIENVLVAVIEAKGFPAQPFPKKPAGYFPEADPGEILVCYKGRKPKKRDLSGLVIQQELYIEIVVVSRQLRGENGIYTWLETLAEQFEGYTLKEVGGAMELENEEFISEENGVWQFTQKWKIIENREYEQRDDYADYPLREA